MNYQEYICKMKEIQKVILEFLEKEDNDEENYENLTKFILIHNFGESKYEIKSLAYLILNIANNHHRSPHFYDKIKQILQYIKIYIQKYLTNSEIFEIFETNSLLLLFFIEENALYIDTNIFNKVKKNQLFINFFIPEINSFIEEEKPPPKVIFNFYDNPKEKDITIFKSKRQVGENGNYINEIIRKDLINEFIIFVQKENLPLDSNIRRSIYETNPFLIKKLEVKLIEYAAFFGSIQIFKYLIANGIELNSSLWLFAIHGNDLEIIKILVENKITPKDITYERCMKEAIKCHHIEIANYILNNHLNMNVEVRNREKVFDKNTINYSFLFYNFHFIPDEPNNDFIFSYACAYDYFQIVDYFIKNKKVDFNEIVVLIKNTYKDIFKIFLFFK